MFKTSLSRHCVPRCHSLERYVLLYKVVLAFEIRVAGKQNKSHLRSDCNLTVLLCLHSPLGFFKWGPCHDRTYQTDCQGMSIQSEIPSAMLCFSFQKPPCHILQPAHKLGWPQRSSPSLGDTILPRGFGMQPCFMSLLAS